MNELELRAYGCVAQAVAQHAYAMAEAEDKNNRNGHSDAPRPIYYRWATSTFEAVASDLWRLGIFMPLDERGGWAHYFVFNCTTDEANIVAERNACAGPPLAARPSARQIHLCRLSFLP